MFVLTNLGLIIFTTILFIASFFIIKTIKTTGYILNLKINNLVREILTGITYSGLFILFQIIMKAISKDFSCQIFLIGFVLLTIVLNYRVAIYSFPLPLVYFLLMNDIDPGTYAMIIAFLSVSVVYLIIINFVEGALSKVILHCIVLGIGLISFLITDIAFNSGTTEDIFANQFLPLILFPIIELLVSYTIKVSIEANILYDSINFVFGKYCRESIKDKIIGEYISKNKITQAIYVLFDIKFKTKLETVHKEILDSVLADIQNTVPQESILFSNGGESYGMFLPMNFHHDIKESIKNNSLSQRDENDPFKKIENYLTKVSKKYRVYQSHNVKVQAFAGVSIYGLQSSSIKKLSSNAKFALKINKRNPKNRLTLFDPSLYRTKVIDSYNVKSLDDSIGLDNFVNRFSPIINLDTMETHHHYAYQINVSELEFISDVKKYINDLGFRDIFERYFAIDVLKEIGFSRESIIIDYSISRFSKSFLVHEFTRQLKYNKINFSKLILLTDFSDLNKINDFEETQKIIKHLKKRGIRFAINSLKYTKIDFDLYVIPFENLKQIKVVPEDKLVIVPNIQSEEEFIITKNKGVKNIGGSLFQINTNIDKINKQSKIYIEELVSEKGEYE